MFIVHFPGRKSLSQCSSTWKMVMKKPHVGDTG